VQLLSIRKEPRIMAKALTLTKRSINHLPLLPLHMMPSGDISGTLAPMIKLKRDTIMSYQKIFLNSKM